MNLQPLKMNIKAILKIYQPTRIDIPLDIDIENEDELDSEVNRILTKYENPIYYLDIL